MATGDSPGGFQPKGALFECFMEFPQFRDDFEVLIAEGYIKTIGPETCEWTKSKTSLAEYFKWAGYDSEWVVGGFWSPIEACFGVNRRTLSRLASNNANPLKPERSRDFIKIKAALEKHHREEHIKYNEKRIYNYIKKLILFAEDEEPETIHEIVRKIGAIFLKNVDKNVQNRH
jgi:hypothetical protein